MRKANNNGNQYAPTSLFIDSLTLPALSGHLWEAANILRGPVDAADFKTYIFPLLFFKRISDVFEEEMTEAMAVSGGDQQFALFPENHRFQIPEECHWSDVRAKTANVGKTLQHAMREIEKANPDTLYGIFGDSNWTNKDRLSDELLRDLIEHFSRLSLGNRQAKADTFDRECCVLYKKVLDELVGPDASAVVMNAPKDFGLPEVSKDDEEKLLDRFRDPADPLKFLIVTARLLTGFDAPILQVMYLDKPMRDHNLLQAICRTNRPYTGKTHGLIVDYLGIFDDVAKALDFDEKAVQQVITNLDELKKQLPEAVTKALSYFPKVDRSVGGYEGLIAAQECLPNNEKRDAFAADYSVVARLWEALSPDPCLNPYETDFKWLTQVYESVKPPSGNGKLLWHALGAKTIEMIHQNVHMEGVRDDLDTLVMDAEVLEGLAASKDPSKTKEIEIKIVARVRKHKGDPKFVALGERLERLRERHEQGLLTSKEFLKQLLEIAKDVLSAEKTVTPEEEQDRAKAALTDLFSEVKTKDTPVIVERIVADIDEIVRLVRFPDWQQTSAGEREVKQALRRTLLKYKLHQDQELFDRAYAYVREYY